MGRGDKKTAKGKRTMGSYGNSRKRKSTSTKPVVAAKAEKTVDAEKKPAAKKPAAKKATTKTKETSAE